MKRFLVSGSLFVVFIGLSTFYSCTKDTAPPLSNANCDSTKITFTRNIQPIFVSNCATVGCHDATTKQNGIDLSTYSDSRRSVSDQSTDQLNAVCRMQGTACGDQMPSGRRALSTATIDTVIQWRTDGFCD